jgi:NADH-quinone oxidoreductase subunit E
MNRDSELTPEETAEIRAAASHCPHPSGAAIEALRIVQQRRRWVSDAALSAVAELLGMPPAELDGIATFYNLIYRQPVGQTVIHTCDSVSCWMLGADQVRAHLALRLGIAPGGTTADGRYTLLPIVCLGACDQAPALLFGTELHGDMDPDRIDALLAGP